MLDKIGHVALIVKDSSRTATLFKDLFGAAILVRKDVDGHEETYVRLGPHLVCPCTVGSGTCAHW
jgi:hypothetical protein